jgi:hypothetical protein
MIRSLTIPKAMNAMLMMTPAIASPLPRFGSLFNWLSAIRLKISPSTRQKNDRTKPAIANPFQLSLGGG